MAGVGRIPRRRGSLCGLLLILLGAWGGLAPFIGPYFKFAFTPDKTWAYTTGRLYLSIVPGAAALLGGLLVLATRSRAVGVLGGLLATLGGAWFIAGAGIVGTVLQKTSISPGTPVGKAGLAVGSHSYATWIFLEEIGFFVGVGILIVAVGAIAMGRFSLLSASDTADSGYDDYSDLPDQPSVSSPAASFPSATGQFPSATGQFPASPKPFPGEEPTQTQDRFPASSGQFPASGQSPFPPATSPFQTGNDNAT
jgi:hypothetical protein